MIYVKFSLIKIQFSTNLQQSYEQEKTVRIPPKLFEQENWHERQNTILGGRYTIRTALIPLCMVNKNRSIVSGTKTIDRIR